MFNKTTWIIVILIISSSLCEDFDTSLSDIASLSSSCMDSFSRSGNAYANYCQSEKSIRKSFIWHLCTSIKQSMTFVCNNPTLSKGISNKRRIFRYLKRKNWNCNREIQLLIQSKYDTDLANYLKKQDNICENLCNNHNLPGLSELCRLRTLLETKIGRLKGKPINRNRPGTDSESNDDQQSKRMSSNEPSLSQASETKTAKTTDKSEEESHKLFKGSISSSGNVKSVNTSTSIKTDKDGKFSKEVRGMASNKSSVTNSAKETTANNMKLKTPEDIGRNSKFTNKTSTSGSIKDAENNPSMNKNVKSSEKDDEGRSESKDQQKDKNLNTSGKVDKDRSESKDQQKDKNLTSSEKDNRDRSENQDQRDTKAKSTVTRKNGQSDTSEEKNQSSSKTDENRAKTQPQEKLNKKKGDDTTIVDGKTKKKTEDEQEEDEGQSSEKRKNDKTSKSSKDGSSIVSITHSKAIKGAKQTTKTISNTTKRPTARTQKKPDSSGLSLTSYDSKFSNEEREKEKFGSRNSNAGGMSNGNERKENYGTNDDKSYRRTQETGKYKIYGQYPNERTFKKKNPRIFNEDGRVKSSHFIVYGTIGLILLIALYVLYQKRQKILALIVEGRRQRGASGSGERSRRGSGGVAYKPLINAKEENVDDRPESLQKYIY